MRVSIETYRSFDIIFDTEKETFSAGSDLFDTTTKEKNALSRLKAEIDDFIKASAKFTPFFLELKPDEYSTTGRRIHIIGIRKDGRLVYENKAGNKVSISEWDEKRYTVYNPNNQSYWEEHNKIKERIQALTNDLQKLNLTYQPGETVEQIRQRLAM
jgi:hypothetical protein